MFFGGETVRSDQSNVGPEGGHARRHDQRASQPVATGERFKVASAWANCVR